MEPDIPERQDYGDSPAHVVGGNTVVTTRLPSAGFSITIRIAVTADASSIGRLTTCVGEAGAIVTALDAVDSDPTRVLVDLTCDTADSSHADQVVNGGQRRLRGARHSVGTMSVIVSPGLSDY